MLSIETSCDDTCVALINRPDNGTAELIQHVKSTLDSTEVGGIIPTAAFDHHQSHISGAVERVLKENGLGPGNPPDLICATRGPGMKGSLSIGLDFAKGLSVAYGKPLVGVHHMLGHLLVPRFESGGVEPQFPFLSLLISGGHTMLVLSESLLKHEILCDTIDVAAGDALDKTAREIGLKGNNLGRTLEEFVQTGKEDWHFKKYELPTPLSNKPGRLNQQNFSFSPFQGVIKRLILSGDYDPTNIRQQRALAYQSQKSIFDHVVNKVKLTIDANKDKLKGVNHFVASGGVASNLYLRTRLNDCFEGTEIAKVSYPSLELCSDNAVMIGWAGIELYEAEGLTTNRNVVPISKWPLSDIMNVSGWKSEREE